MKHTGTVEIITERLLLRPFQMEDANAMFNNWANDEDVVRYMTWLPHKNVDLTQSIIEVWVNKYNQDNYYQWAICFKDKPKSPIGSFSIISIDEQIKAFEVGYCIGKKWWGQGIITEAFNEVIQLSFNQIGANRIFAYHHIDNPSSGRVMEKCGLQKEGHLREVALNNQGELIDLILYSVLASDKF